MSNVILVVFAEFVVSHRGKTFSPEDESLFDRQSDPLRARKKAVLQSASGARILGIATYLQEEIELLTTFVFQMVIGFERILQASHAVRETNLAQLRYHLCCYCFAICRSRIVGCVTSHESHR